MDRINQIADKPPIPLGPEAAGTRFRRKNSTRPNSILAGFAVADRWDDAEIDEQQSN
jgi:hypothetical protein